MHGIRFTVEPPLPHTVGSLPPHISAYGIDVRKTAKIIIVVPLFSSRLSHRHNARLRCMHFHANPSPSQSQAFEAHSLTASIETRLPRSGHPMFRGLKLASQSSRAKFARITSSILLTFLAPLRSSRRCRPNSLTPRSRGGALGSLFRRRSRSIAFRC